MQEELDDALMQLKGFGKRQCFTNKAPQALAQGVVEAFNGVGWSFGIRGLVLSGGQDIVIAFQLIGVHRALTVSGWDPSPQKLSRGIVART